MPLPFNKSLDLKLIKLVKENPILYDIKNMKYMDFDSREVVWQKIGDELNRPGLMCKSRWINIRDMMRKKVKERMKNPNHSRHYKYEEELAFMVPYFRDIPSNGADDYSEYLEDEAEIEMPTEVFIEDEDTKDRLLTLKPMKTPNIHNEANTSNFETLCQDLSTTDPLDVFLITIGSTLRKFSPYYLNQAKSKIFQVVQDYELQQIVDKDDRPGASDSNR